TRHFYEIILENQPCHLYFDIEFLYNCNDDNFSDQLIDVFIKYLNKELQTVFNLSISPEDVIDLESLSPEKFSHHLIVKLKDAVFKDNIHVGNFVNNWVGKLRQLR